MTAATAPRTARDAERASAVPATAMVRETIAVAAVLCGTVPALLPLTEAGITNTHDGLIHVQRLIALEAVISQGTLFTRWLPDLAYGYGQPLLLYYAPLAYLPALASRLLGAGYAASIEIVSGLALICSALAMYVFARSLFGPVAATVAAIVYAVLPYQLVDVYVRGALAESWAFVWLPLCAWCLTRAWTDERPIWSVGLALTVAGLVLTHNVTALLFLPALVVLGPVLQLSARFERRGPRSGRHGVPFRPIVGLSLGLVVSAWFWLPALAERHLVQIGETIEPELFASFFVRTWPPFRLDLLYDYQYPVSRALGTPIFWPQLGLIQVGVTVVGGVVAAKTSGVVRGVAIWAALLALGGYVMQLRPLAPLYEIVPLLTFVQFPWRLLTLVGLGSAILAGVLVEVLSRRAAIRGVFATAIVGASLLTALAELDPEPLPIDEQMLSVETITRGELADYGLGTTHSGEYLPVSSGQRNAARFRKTILDAGGGQARQQASSPSALQIEQIDWRPDRIRAQVKALTPDRLILHQFAFPGWTAWVDGSPVAAEAAGQLGLLAVSVPAGRHAVEIAWSWTPLRLGAAFVSLAGLLLLAPLAGLTLRQITSRRAGVAVLTVGLGAAVFGSSARPATVAATVPHPRPMQQIDDDLTLVDTRIDTSRLALDRIVESRLIWLVRQPPSSDYRAFVELVAPDGELRHRAPLVHGPVSRVWERGELVPTTVAIRLPSGLQGGEFRLLLAFDQPASVQPVEIGRVVVTESHLAPRSSSEPERVEIGLDVRLESGQVRELPLRARPGRPLDVPLSWEQIGVTPNVDRELLAVAVLTATRGEVVSEPRRPGDWFAPLPFWQRGDLVQQNVRLYVPAWMPRGLYPLVVRVYSRDLARSGISEPGASSARPRGRPVAELAVGDVSVEP